MHLADDFSAQLATLCDVDQAIGHLLSIDDINTEEITAQVDTREQILQKLLCMIEQCPELAQLPAWQRAIDDTAAMVQLMQQKTALAGQALKQYRHGQRSVQQYKKFL